MTKNGGTGIKMKKFFCLLLCALLLILPLACEKAEKDAELVTVELHEVTRSVFYAPQYVAAALGFFEEEGLQVNITTSGGSDKAMTAMLAGEADIILTGPETCVYVAAEGRSDAPVIIGQLTRRDGSFLVSRVDEPNFDWSNLEGKTVIGGRPGGMPLMTLLYVMNQHGLTPGVNVEVIDSIQFPLMAGAFEGGTGDYVTLFEPTATEFEKAGKGYIVASVGMDSGNIPYTVYAMTPTALAEKPELAEAFIRAIYKAQQWILTATDLEVAKAMQPYFPDASEESLTYVASSYRESQAWKTEPMMYQEDYEHLLDVIEFNGFLTVRPAFEDVVNNSIAEKVMGE